MYFGASGGGLDGTADVTITGAAGELIGSAVSPAGDVNADGFADFLIGSPNNDIAATNAGRVYLYFGGPTATLDTNPDGTFSGEAQEHLFGGSASGAGDVNGDGYGDIIIGAAEYDAPGAGSFDQRGRVYVFMGGPTTPIDPVPDGTLTGEAPIDNLGIAVASAGDVNGDGYADVVVGAYRSDAGNPAGDDRGKAFVLYGGAGPVFDGTADWSVAGAASGDWLGSAVASADVNGDGYSDVLIGTSRSNGDIGRVYIYRGGASFDTAIDVTLSGIGVGDRYGNSVGSACDANADGYADIIVGAPYNDAATGMSTDNRGRAYVYFGSAGVFNTGVDGTLTGAASGDRLGERVAPAMDVNGDGYCDVIVGAPYNDAGGASTDDRGRAYVYFGASGTSFDTSADGTLTGAAAGDRFGNGVGAGAF
jgi:hypothetical protein